MTSNTIMTDKRTAPALFGFQQMRSQRDPCPVLSEAELTVELKKRRAIHWSKTELAREVEKVTMNSDGDCTIAITVTKIPDEPRCNKCGGVMDLYERGDCSFIICSNCDWPIWCTTGSSVETLSKWRELNV